MSIYSLSDTLVTFRKLQMTLIVFAVLASSREYNFCFYKSSASKCPGGYDHVKISDFQSFEDRKITDGEKFTFAVLDDMTDSRGNRLVFEFAHLKRDDGQSIAVEIVATGDQRECAIDQSSEVYASIVTNLTLDNLELYTSASNPTFSFTNLVLRWAVFVDVSQYSLTVTNELCSDPGSLKGFESYNVQYMKLEAAATWPAANPTKFFDMGLLKRLDISDSYGELIVQVVGDQLRVADGSAPEDSSITVNMSGVDIDRTTVQMHLIGAQSSAKLYCLAYGVGYRVPVIDIRLYGGALISMEDSSYPKLTTVFARVSVNEMENGQLSIASASVPLMIDVGDASGNLKVTTTCNTRISGPVTLSGSHLTMAGSSGGVFAIDSLAVETSAVIEAEGGPFSLSVGTVTLGGDLVVNGNAKVDFGVMPKQAEFTVTAETLVVNDATIGFTLDGAGTLKGTKSISLSNVSVDLVYVGGEIDQASIDAHAEKEITLMCGSDLPETVDIKLSYSGPNGVTSSTSLYDKPKITAEKCLTIQLKKDAKLSDVSNSFCIGTDSGACPAGTTFLESPSDYQGYVASTAENISFFVAQWPEGASIDFSGYANVDVSFEGGEISLMTLAGLHSITGKDTTIEIPSTTVVKTNLDLVNSKIGDKISCDSSITIDVDRASLSYLSVDTEKCKPSELRVNGWNGPAKVKRTTTGFKITDESEEVHIIDFNQVFLGDISDSIEFLAGDVQTQNGSFSFTIAGQGNIIFSDDLSSSYYDVTGYDVNGTIVAKSENVPISIRGSADVSIRSDLETVTLTGSLPNDLNLHVDELETGHTFRLLTAAFGAATKVTDSTKKGTLAVVDGHAADELPAPIPSLRLDNTMTVSPSSHFQVTDASVKAASSATLNVQYSLGQLPRVVLNGSSGAVDKLHEIVITYTPPGKEESDFIEANRKDYERMAHRVVCGTNFNCDNVNIRLASSAAAFQGDKALIETFCEKVDASYSCVGVNVVKKGTIFWYVVGFTYMSIAVIIFICDALYFIFAPRLPYDVPETLEEVLNESFGTGGTQ